jgi:hypothetical protein
MAKKDPFKEIMANIDWTRLVPILQPLIIFGAWVMFTKFDNKAKWLSSLFSVTEMIPGVNLNLPSGVVLGSFYVTAEEVLETGLIEDIKEAWDNTSSLVEDFIKKEGIYEEKTIGEDIEVVTSGITSFFNWLEKKVEESDVEIGGKGLA